MKTSGASLALVATLTAGLMAGAVGAAESKRPPSKLKKVGDHWTAWDSPEPAAGAYVIQKGDTLWDLSAKWFNDPFLWPQIWDQNRYILDSHWIYPGDPLVVPGKPLVVPEQGELPTPPVAVVTPVDAPEPERKLPPAPVPPPLLPMADESDLYCTGYIDPAAQALDLRIAGRDLERVGVAEGDVVFLSHGQDAGIRSGDEFSILRRAQTVFHPETKEPLGTLVRRLGEARVLVAHEDRSTALITMSCEEIVDGDELKPREDLPVPMRSALPAFDRYSATPSGGPSGYVVTAKDDLPAIGTGNIIYTDLGRTQGVQPGDVLGLFRERDSGLPRLNLGQAVVLTVGDETSTARVVTCTRESLVGDRVEVAR